MAFDAVIKFTGLCGFVRHTSRERMSVVLANARLGGLVSDPRHAHTPAIVFDVRDAETQLEPPQPDFGVYEGRIGVWELKYDEVMIVPTGGTNPFRWTDPVDVGLRPTSERRHLLDWLPRMSRVSEGAGPILDACLEGDASASTRRVTARIRVRHGAPRVTTHTATLGVYHTWDFQTRRGAPIRHRQTLAEEVEIRLRGLEVLTFEARRFDRSNPRRLRLIHKSGGDHLEVSIKNVELDQIIRPRYNEYPASFADFRYLYRLCQLDMPVENLPHLHEETLFQTLRSDDLNLFQPLLVRFGQILALSRPICPGAVFNDNGYA